MWKIVPYDSASLSGPVCMDVAYFVSINFASTTFWKSYVGRCRQIVDTALSSMNTITLS